MTVKRELCNHRILRPHPNVTGFKEVRTMTYNGVQHLLRIIHTAKNGVQQIIV